MKCGEDIPWHDIIQVLKTGFSSFFKGKGQQGEKPGLLQKEDEEGDIRRGRVKFLASSQISIGLTIPGFSHLRT